MIVEFEGWVRLAAFLGVFAAVATWELARPVRKPALPHAKRWPHNLGLLLVDVAVVRILRRAPRSPSRSPAKRAAGACSTPSPCPRGPA
jgi:hypothetical protein